MTSQAEINAVWEVLKKYFERIEWLIGDDEIFCMPKDLGEDECITYWFSDVKEARKWVKEQETGILEQYKVIIEEEDGEKFTRYFQGEDQKRCICESL